MSARKQSRHRSLQRRFLDAGKAVLLVGILIAVALLSAMVGMRIAVRRTEVTVPKVVGLTSEDAQKVLSQVDLKLDVTGQRYDDSTPAGRITSQFPEQGGRMKAKRSLQVQMSLGPRTNPVPKLVGLTLRVAQLTAAQYNYEVGRVSEIPREGTTKDEVVQQFPPAGSANALSPKINLLVAKGVPERYIMPDVTGQNLNEVQPYLEARGFKLPSVQYRFYSNVRKGTVVKQFPERGYLLAGGDTINLEVAR